MSASDLSLVELSQTIMPFGKHKGRPFDEVPLPYLDWLIGQDFLRDPLRAKVQAYLNHPTIKKELEKELS